MDLLLQYVVAFAVVIPIGIGIIVNVFRDRRFRPIFILLLVSLFIEIIGTLLASYNINTLWLFNLFTLCEFFLIWNFYFKFIKGEKTNGVNYFILSFFVLVALVDLFFINGFERINNITISVESITLIIYSLISFYLIMSRMLFDKLLDAPFFWMNIAVLFYFSGSLFLFLFGNYLISQGNKAYLEMYKIHTFVNAIWYLFISIGFWKVKKA